MGFTACCPQQRQRGKFAPVGFGGKAAGTESPLQMGTAQDSSVRDNKSPGSSKKETDKDYFSSEMFA